MAHVPVTDFGSSDSCFILGNAPRIRPFEFALEQQYLLCAGVSYIDFHAINVRRVAQTQPGRTGQFDLLYRQATSTAAAQDCRRTIELYNQAVALDPLRAEAYSIPGNRI